MYNIEVIKGGDVVEINIPDSTFNTDDTSLTLIGRDAVSYGEALNENMVKLLSNSAGPNEPTQPVVGEMWFNTLDQKLYVNSIKGFSVLGSAKWLPSMPSINESNVGDLWVNSVTKQLYVFGGDTYTLVGPSYDASNGVTTIEDRVINDSIGVKHVVGVIKVADQDLGFFSNSTFSYPGYGEVVRGFNPLGGSFVINASILSAKNLERGSELIPADDVAVKGEPANFTDVQVNSIEVSSAQITVESGKLKISNSVDVPQLIVGDVLISASGQKLLTDSLVTTSIETSELSVSEITGTSNISVNRPIILSYESTVPSNDPLSASPKQYVDGLISEVNARPLTVTMHTPALDVATLQGVITEYVSKLFPNSIYPVNTTARIIAVQTQVKNKLIVSDYATATVHVYQLQSTGWQYMYSEE